MFWLKDLGSRLVVWKRVLAVGDIFSRRSFARRSVFLAYRSELPRSSKQLVVGGAVCSAYELGSGVASRHECIVVASQSVVSS